MTTSVKVVSGSLKAHCARLPPGADLVPTLQECARQALQNKPGSAFVLSAVGSLSSVTLRMASAKDGESGNHVQNYDKECFEIVSLVGTFALDAKHLHMCLSNANGETIGGHLVAGTVFTTVELVLGTAEGVVFDRTMDPKTGYRELVVSHTKPT